jgi:hypothetical protein
VSQLMLDFDSAPTESMMLMEIDSTITEVIAQA